MIDIKNLMMGGFDYVKNYGLRFFISNDIWNIKNKFNQQYSVVPNEQQFCTETIKSSRGGSINLAEVTRILPLTVLD